MLVQDLYHIKQMNTDDGIKAVLVIHSEHPIFKGHFPEVPVLPGVCMIQMIKEIIEQSFGIRTILNETDMIKFLYMVNPEIHNELFVDINIKEQTFSNIHYNATMKNVENIVLKCSGRLHIN